ncbi:hypothetical protein OEG84_15705 [Hoeflea sp. G2-23]|uniref:Uncharacterized protein n=1 Tax=Hoeflea algicola TaxID=2983763 RepID=A0ABT3ZBD5_9HYPH|nr:hypothetical protein [Hoeflea algicola]MCY0149113.1 hypothetical protein [Hoeflea algicola]
MARKLICSKPSYSRNIEAKEREIDTNNASKWQFLGIIGYGIDILMWMAERWLLPWKGRG